MFKIGAFSKITNTTIRTLHHYEDLGLFMPVKYNEKTGYRFYSSDQIKDLNKIKVLQEVGFSLSQIKEMSQSTDLEFVREKLNLREFQLHEEIKDMEAKLQLLNAIKNGKEPSDKYHVDIKEIPERSVVSVRRLIDGYHEEGVLWNELYDKINDLDTKISNPYFGMTIYHDKEYKLKEIDIEVQVSIDTSDLQLHKEACHQVPSFKIVSTVFSGDYEQMNDVCEALANWAEHHDFELSGEMINIPIVSPAQSDDTREWITEAGYIIIEKEK
ncbi:MAG: MerR family transcriptional regulator [Erysipelothrix sp.]